MKKSGFVLLCIFSGLLVGCGSDNSTPSSNDVADVQTFDQMMQAKEDGKAVSEFDLCTTEAKKYTAWEEQFKADCEGDKLVAKGYTDGVDCIEKRVTGTPEEQRLCDTPRYNAEVQATNECRKLKNEADLPSGIKKVNPFDCMALMGK
jgi:hypothetical protein